jgi:hypothetical protein
MVKMHAIIKGCGHQKTTGKIGTTDKSEDPAIMTIMALIAK